MDRFVPRRRRNVILPALLTLTLALGAATGGRAALPTLSDEPAGDPGDGVLRPADVSAYAPSPSASASSAVTTATAEPVLTSFTYMLVPIVAPTGSPWTLTFRLLRVEQSDAAWVRPGRSFPSGGRWHRAP